MTERGEYTPGFFTDMHAQVGSGEPTCRGSYGLGTACGKCKRCREELERMKPKFKVKPETLGPDVIANFRVRPDVHAKIKELADATGVSIQDVVRQMIDFALEHL